MKPIWRILLGLYTLAVGLAAVLNLTFDGYTTIMGVLACIVGVLIWLDK